VDSNLGDHLRHTSPDRSEPVIPNVLPDDHDLSDHENGTKWVYRDENSVQRCTICGVEVELVGGARSGMVVCRESEESLFYY
jgi:hypothetical protein